MSKECEAQCARGRTQVNSFKCVILCSEVVRIKLLQLVSPVCLDTVNHRLNCTLTSSSVSATVCPWDLSLLADMLFGVRVSRLF
jgi:hypothetical protein